ncbi:MAG TPA: hypothetical protein VL093_05460 [Flavipsychrobacter sp.]|nr:hypothetical protein [Flavipsychrobacter sp.]
MNSKLKACLFTAILFLPFSSFAKFPGVISHLQLGYSFLSNKADYTSTFMLKGFGQGDVDTAYKPYEMETTLSWGFTAGTYFPLKRLGQATSLCLNVDYMYNLMTWKSKVPGFAYENNFELDGATVQMALPIGLDIKYGAHAVSLKHPRFCGAIGAGVYPSYALTTLTGVPITLDPAFSVAPYVKAEVGIYAGICMKVRAMYAIGDLTYMDYKHSESGGGIDTKGTAKLVGKSNFAISLLIMPFSYKWSTEDWWNTY